MPKTFEARFSAFIENHRGDCHVKVWLITVGEPLPLPGARDRLWRTGLVAEVLASRGHEVLWWTSTVNHFRKERFVQVEQRVPCGNGVTIQFLDGPLYRRNISLARIVNHRQVARSFARHIRVEARPDIVLCSFPTIELSARAVEYGQASGIPVVLDVRDLWPDIFLNTLPSWLRWLGRTALVPAFAAAARAFRSATNIIAVSEGYLQWGLVKAARVRRAGDEVFPLGYRMSEWSDADARRLDERLLDAGVTRGVPIALFVGTFGQTYDVGTVIEAARLLNRDHRLIAQFVICGSGERANEWQRAATNVPGVAFSGWLSARELACLLSRASFGLAAYVKLAPQGVPNKVIEYLAAGLPILCSLAGESRRLLESEGCGLHYTAGAAPELASGLRTLVEDRARAATMAAAARATFESYFSAASVYGALADYLEERSGLGHASSR